MGLILCRVQFPGAVNSKFTTEMSFINPTDLPSIPTFRVMNSDGELLDPNRKPLGVSNEEILTWYKNMLAGAYSSFVVLFIRGAISRLTHPSECHGRDHVRGPATRPSQFLHGMSHPVHPPPDNQ